jgi:hypothetical protein
VIARQWFAFADAYAFALPSLCINMHAFHIAFSS